MRRRRRVVNSWWTALGQLNGERDRKVCAQHLKMRVASAAQLEVFQRGVPLLREQKYSRERATTQSTEEQYSRPAFRGLCLYKEPLGIRKIACREEVEVALGPFSQH